ncbi:acyltransferase family protein [Roseateles sp. P5_E8]
MLNNIQILRAFAALNVVLFHVITAGAAYQVPPAALGFLSRWGENGVDVFFVISGFVMVHAHATKKVSPWEFMKLRIERIAPMYWLLTLVLAATILIIPSLSKTQRMSWNHAGASLLFSSEFFLDRAPAIYVDWSLEYEMLFYLLLGSGLLARHEFMRLAVPAFGVIALTQIGTNAIILEFLFGVIVGGLYSHGHLRAHVGWILALGIALLCKGIPFSPANNRVIVWGLPSALIVLGAALTTQSKSSFLGLLGAASYSTYLVQVLTIPAFYKLTTPLLKSWPSDALALAAVAFTGGVGCAVYKFVEKPIATWLKGARMPQDKKVCA